MKQKIKGISINKNGVHYEKSNDADVGELEQVEEVVVTTKTYLSNTRVMFHIVGAKDGIDEPKLDEILYNMKRQLIQRNNSPLLQGKGMKIVFFQVLRKSIKSKKSIVCSHYTSFVIILKKNTCLLVHSSYYLSFS